MARGTSSSVARSVARAASSLGLTLYADASASLRVSARPAGRQLAPAIAARSKTFHVWARNPPLSAYAHVYVPLSPWTGPSFVTRDTAAQKRTPHASPRSGRYPRFADLTVSYFPSQDRRRTKTRVMVPVSPRAWPGFNARLRAIACEMPERCHPKTTESKNKTRRAGEAWERRAATSKPDQVSNTSPERRQTWARPKTPAPVARTPTGLPSSFN